MPDVNPKKSSPDPVVNCRECMKAVQSSEAYSPEGIDYEIGFCSAACYEAWSRKALQAGDEHGKK